MNRSIRTRRGRNSSRSIVPIESASVGTSTPTFVPVGRAIRWFKGENPDGPEYSVIIRITHFGLASGSTVLTLIARNGTQVTHPLLHSLYANVTATASAAGDVSISLQTESPQSVLVFYTSTG